MPPLLGITYAFDKALPKNIQQSPITPMTTPKHMGEKLQQEAERMDLKPSKIAEIFGVKPPSVYDWYKHGRIDKMHYQKLVDWSGRTIEWWLDLRPKAGTEPEPAHSEYARVLTHLFDTLPDHPPTRTSAFLDCSEVIKKASVSPSTDPPAPTPTPFAKLGKPGA